MGISVQDIRRLIQETLEPRGLWSQNIEELLIMTYAIESDGGTKLYQYGDGPARGIFQMEGATEKDIWENFLKYKPELIRHFDGVQRHLAGNIVYQILMARMHYLRNKNAIPKHTEVLKLAQYYKDVWNTRDGKSTVQMAVQKYVQYH